MTMSATPSRFALVLAFATIYVVWGSTYLAIRFAIESMPPFGMAAVRFLVAGFLLYGWARLRGATRPTPREWRSTSIVGLCLLLGGNGLVVWAEQTVPSGIAALIVATVPLWIVSLSGLLGERPSLSTIAGVAAGLAGIGLLVGPSEIGGSAAFDPWGVAALVAASGAWSAGSLYATRATLPSSGSLATAMQMIAGGFGLAATAVLRGEDLTLAGSSQSSLWALGYLIVFGSLIGYSAYVWLLRHVDPSKVATYAYVNPVVAVLLGWWLAGEEVSARTAVAAVVIVGAVFLITTGRSRRAASQSEEEQPEEPQPEEPQLEEPDLPVAAASCCGSR